jgi:hypothetical protein
MEKANVTVDEKKSESFFKNTRNKESDRPSISYAIGGRGLLE